MLTERLAQPEMPENEGRLSPITSSSGQQTEEPDNSIEYYVKANKEESEYVDAKNNNRAEVCCTCKFFIEAEEACTVVSGRIEAQAYCKLYIEGGEKMTEKGLDVDQSVTTDDSYTQNATTTEPDPESELAMQKSATLQGEGTYSTTANSTTDAPAAGQTTEPSSVHKASCCDDCGPECSGSCCEKCSKMAKAAGCSCTCEQCQKCSMGSMKKSDDEEADESKEEEAAEDEKTETVKIKKSLWGNAFLPID